MLMGLSRLIVYARISAQKKRIIGPNDCWLSVRYTISTQKKSGIWGHFKGQIYTFFEKQSPMGISSQNILLNNFSTLGPIFTNIMPIDPAPQV
jgi:hypothetical protein